MAGRLLRQLPLIVGLGLIVAVWIGLNATGIYFRDTLAYWRPDFSDLYGGREVGVMSTYLYSPAFAQLVSPLGLLPWPAFAALWSALNLAALVWMVGPILGAIFLLIPGPVADEVSTGNIHLLLAAAVVLGLRQPTAWALHLLTKVTPGVGVLWFVGRREWRQLGVAIGATAIIVVVSFALHPQAWVEWIDTLRRSSGTPVPGEVALIPGPLWLRGVVAVVIAVLAGLRGWGWLVPVAVAVALPVPWSSGMAVLVASIPLSRAWWGPRLDHLRIHVRNRGGS